MSQAAAPVSFRIPQDSQRILAGCRDLAVQRFAALVDAALAHVEQVLGTRAKESDDAAVIEAAGYARELVATQRAAVVEEFRRLLRAAIDERAAGRRARSRAARDDVPELKLLDDAEMEEAVSIGNLARMVDSQCQDEVVALTQRVGALLGEPDLEQVGNPFAPGAVFDAFRNAWASAGANEVRVVALRALDAAAFGDVRGVYAEMNRQLIARNVLPMLKPRSAARRRTKRARSGPGELAGGGDLIVALQQVLSRLSGGPASPTASQESMSFDSGEDAGAALGSILEAAGAQNAAIDRPVVAALTRLQQGEDTIALDDGRLVRLATTVPEPGQNILREIRNSALGERMHQIDAVTIELVAMLFDFIFVDRNIPDGIKALVGRLQIPVLKAAMLDREFFSKKTHPARVLVNRLAQVGLEWSPEMGSDDPLYRKVESIVITICERFTDEVELFSGLVEDLEAFLAAEGQRAEANLKAIAAEVERQDRVELAQFAARSEIERRLLQPLPAYVVDLLRTHWVGRLEKLHPDEGEVSEAWNAELALVDDLLWSVQPKRNAEERRRLTAMLPDLIRRLNHSLAGFQWSDEQRKAFIGQLVEAHAAAVKAVQPAAGEAAEAAAAPEPLPHGVHDDYSDLAASMARGMWVQFEAEDGKLSYAKLAWVSPMRGTLLFTNRQGQQAFSLSPVELAARFRANRARPIDAEPLIERAFSNMMNSLAEQADELSAAGA